MRESVGGLSLFQIVIAFILLFTAIMCLTINHSKAFAVKDEIVSIIEESAIDSAGNLSDKTIETIMERLAEIGYQATGHCEEGWQGYSPNNNDTMNNAFFCLKKVNVYDQMRSDADKHCTLNSCIVVGDDDYPYMYYYKVRLFYKLDIPIVDRMDFNVTSSTKLLTAERSKN